MMTSIISFNFFKKFQNLLVLSTLYNTHIYIYMIENDLKPERIRKGRLKLRTEYLLL